MIPEQAVEAVLAAMKRSTVCSVLCELPPCACAEDFARAALAAAPLLGTVGREGELLAALKPFAEAAECAEKDETDDYTLYGSSARHELTLGHLRKAREVLSLRPALPACAPVRKYEDTFSAVTVVKEMFPLNNLREAGSKPLPAPAGWQKGDRIAVEQALAPFVHEDFCRRHSGNVEGDASPVFQRDNAILTLGDFRRARAVFDQLFPAAPAPAEPKEG